MTMPRSSHRCRTSLDGRPLHARPMTTRALVIVLTSLLSICRAANGQYRIPERSCPEISHRTNADSGFVYLACQLTTPARWKGHQLLPVYPPFMLGAGVGGPVVLEFVITANGQVDSASILVLKSPHDAFSNTARDALKMWQAHPGRRGARPVPVRLSHTFLFVVEAPSQPCRSSAPTGTDTTMICGHR